MSSKMKLFIGAIVVLVLIIGGCGMIMKKAGEKVVEGMMERATNGEADVDIQKDGTMKVTTDEGTYETGGDVPDEWPEDVPVYAGATVQYSGSAADQGMAVMLMSKDSADAVVKFYKDIMASGGWKVESTMQGGGSTIMIGTKGSRTLSIAISGAGEAGTSIGLGVEDSPE